MYAEMYVEDKKKTYKTEAKNRCKSLTINAEKEGFEPPVPVRVHLISSQAHSTTLALLPILTHLGCGEGGIRTRDTLLAYTHFPGALLQPLGHLSYFRWMQL